MHEIFKNEQTQYRVVSIKKDPGNKFITIQQRKQTS